MLNRLQRSLSARLLLVFLCAGAVLLLLVGSILGKGFSLHFRSSIEPFMVHYVTLMQRQLGSPPDRDRALRITADIPVDIHVFGPQGGWSTAPDPPGREQLTGPAGPAAPVSGLSIQGGDGEFQLRRMDDQLILLTRDGEHEIYFQVHDQSAIRHGDPFSLFIFFAILGVLALIYLATRSLFSPIQDIKAGVSEFGRGRLERRISRRRNDELGDLTDSVNRMAQDIGNLLEAKRQMLLGISHELRSPLTRCRINLALLPDSEARRAIDDEITVMDQLVTELLESERLNTPHETIRRERLDLARLIGELAQNEFAERPPELQLEPVTADVDPVRIKLLVRNLLRNAMRYNDHARGAPRVFLKGGGDGFEITVQDHGAGVSPEQIPFLTEPFYRADPSRQRKTGGYGLGLYLCRVIAEAHGGGISVSSAPGRGVRVSCSFPRPGAARG